ncbi:ATP-binding protein [Tundrisphaera sp. TA3]|uniref:ATP-binding protein n=1 Tax=Tundrisphaera sp. TA3 TaxID=3435775 RepID=UPI003EBB803B
MTESDPVLIFDADGLQAASIAEALKPWGLTAIRCPDPDAAVEILGGSNPAAILRVEPREANPFGAAESSARSRKIPMLAVVGAIGDPSALSARVRSYDDWVASPVDGAQLAARILGLSASKARSAAIDPRFLALTVHDLRTPLNVIGLTIRAIHQSMPTKSVELEEDLTFLQDNARQIEKMLAQLGDFCRLLEIDAPPLGVEFDLCRFLSDLVEDRMGRPGAESTPLLLDLNGRCPREVSLDPNRVKMAVQHALSNAMTAAGDSPVRIELGPDEDRIRIAIVVDKPPPTTVHPITLRPDLYERLAGSAAERRGLDLAIASRISELFGGSARLEVAPGQSSTIVLEWPARLATHD